MKRFFITVLAICIILAVFAFPAMASSDITVVFEGRVLELPDPPFIQEGRTLVPMRAFFEALGADVSWDPDTRTAIGVRGDIEVKIPIDSIHPTVNQGIAVIDVPAQIVDGRTYIPLRFVGQALGDEVSWDGATRTITITRGDGIPNFDPAPVIADVVIKTEAVWHTEHYYTDYYISGHDAEGNLLWKKEWTNMPMGQHGEYSDYSLTEKHVYVVVEGTLYALDLFTGEESWTVGGMGAPSAILVDDKGRIYSSSPEAPFLMVVNPDGSIRYRHSRFSYEGIEFYDSHSPYVKEDRVYVTCYGDPIGAACVIFDRDTGDVIAVQDYPCMPIE